MTFLFLALLLAPEVSASVLPTNIEDPAALARLRGNSGITLQWIGWERRGRLTVTERGGRVHLAGSQAGNGGRLTIDGDVSGIGRDSLTSTAESSSPIRPIGAANACATGSTNSGSSAAAATGAFSRWRSATG